ncbi:MAG: 1,4-alpha-glucan-branching enzyme [Deltaproteobacteria bacterium]|nr:MAG: 1,4-alpha-glucan-branching enzyme [Deltaproteobacteria bacterium]
MAPRPANTSIYTRKCFRGRCFPRPRFREEAHLTPPSLTSVDRFIEKDPLLAPYAPVLRRRAERTRRTEARLTGNKISLSDFATGHTCFGLHREEDHWVFREWAPNATTIYLIGDMTGWRETAGFALEKKGIAGVWEIRLPLSVFSHKDLYRLRIHWPGGAGDRIPAWARRVVQDPDTLIFNAQVWDPPEGYHWRCLDFSPPGEPPLIYEVHIGMAQETGKVGTFSEFTDHLLPRIIRTGYNTIQLMAIQEHPYYASFGYQVSSFFAPSSRFGTPDELKSLIDAAHEAGLAVIMDLVHSHAVANEVEGLSRFDGTLYQYFHEGGRGLHTAWNSRCFDYDRPEVIHFLLSNCRYWLDEYHVDGFRFDGITSMLYLDHGLERTFTSYDDYFNDEVDEGAITYLTLANRLIHQVNPDAITIAEDVSGMPGLALAEKEGGVGFDYRFAMGVPDYWIKLIKDQRDDDWRMGDLWHELTQRRPEEKTISYAESHDQALVGDQTLMFRLAGADLYDHMHIEDHHLAIDRAMALHKLIRLITLATAGHGYLNFMGNEFGHPEWIDFPREGNNWSFHYARRQWHLADDSHLKYHQLARFDRKMIALARRHHWLHFPRLQLLQEHIENKILIFNRADSIFAFNFNPVRSFTDYGFKAPPGSYRMIFSTDDSDFGGHDRLDPGQVHFTRVVRQDTEKGNTLSLYLPNRTGLVLKRQRSDRGHDRGEEKSDGV